MSDTIAVIIKEYLIKNGYDGLAGDECGCDLEDLFCCGSEGIENCRPAKKCDKNCKKCSAYDTGICEYIEDEPTECDYVMREVD